MAFFIEKYGSILDQSNAQAKVITVNCEGHMGAGIALDAKFRWPEMFHEYNHLCINGGLEPGKLFLWPETDPTIICFPTKASWKHPSRIEFIEDGLKTLSSQLKDFEIETIALPHLGCSHGGLEWSEVEPLIRKNLETENLDIEVELWEFDPNFQDEKLVDLFDKLNNQSDEEVSKQLNITKNVVTSLRNALMSSRIHNLQGLHNMPGIGEQSLKKIYDFLLNPETETIQERLFLND